MYIYIYIYTRPVADIYEEYYERGGSRPYVPIQDLREAGQGRIYTRINAPGEIPLSASGDKYYKLGWLLSVPSPRETPPPSPSLPRFPFFVHSSFAPSTQFFETYPPPSSASFRFLPRKATPREEDSLLSQRIYIAVLRSPTLPFLPFLSPLAINLAHERGTV